MKISGKLNLLIIGIVMSFIATIGALVYVGFITRQLHDMQLQAAEVGQNGYRVTDMSKQLLITDRRLSALYPSWQEAVAEMSASLERLATHPAAPLLDASVREQLAATSRIWERSREQFSRVGEGLQVVINADGVDGFWKTGLVSLLNNASEFRGGNEAVVAAANDTEQLLRNADAAVQELLVSNLQELRDRLGAQAASIERSSVTAAGIAVVVILILAVVGVLLFAKRLLRRLRTIESTMGRLADRDMTVRARDTTKDEIGALSSHVNAVLQSLAEFMSGVKQATKQANELKDTLSAGSTEAASASNEISANIGSIKRQISELDKNIEDSTGSIANITAQVSRLTESIESQSGAIEQSTTAIEEMNASIRNVATLSAERKERSDQLRSVVQSGGEKVEETNEIIASVSADVDKVLEVIGIIDGVAAQTNLLSMNAAIESAHAGEAGKGFAVVAEEIRKLADSTSHNAAEIGTTLKAMTERVHRARAASSASRETFDAISKDAEDFSGAMAEISSSMSELSDGSREIVHSSESVREATGTIQSDAREMREESTRIRSAMENIRSISANVMNGIEEIDRGGKEMVDSIVGISDVSNESRTRLESLSELVASFKTDGE